MTLTTLRPQGRLLYLASVLLAFLAASSAPTPIYSLYQQAWGFSPAVLTLVFAIYAFGLLAALLTVGALSDHIGRRPVLRLALALEIFAMLAFLLAGSVPVLVFARLLQGFATGIATSVLGAALIDGDRERGPLINSLAPLLGMACGGLGAGLLAQYAPAPLRLVYVVLLTGFAVQMVLSFRLDETVNRRPGALASLRPRLRVPVAARSALWRVLPVNSATWALGGFFLSLAPSVVRDATGNGSRLLGGGLVAVLTLTGAAAIHALRAQSGPVAIRAGATALASGITLFLLGMNLGQVGLILAGTLVAGFGFGASFLGATRILMPLAEAHERAAFLSAYYVLSYLAFCVPALIAGNLAREFGVVTTADGYGALLIGLCLLALPGLRTAHLSPVRS